MDEQDAIVARARGCVGARYRPFGRIAAFGLDCVGVAGIALGLPVPANYQLRGGDAERIAQSIARPGLERIATDAAGAGDLTLLEAGIGQLHLIVLTERGYVHADAMLRRVVETPGAPAGLLLGVWRKEG